MHHPKALITIVRGYDPPPGTILCLLALKYFGLGPVQIEETASRGHLLSVINHHCIMHGGMRQGIIPGRIRIVEIGSGILGNVQAAPPQIQVKLVGVTRSVVETGCPQISPGMWSALV